MRPIDADALLEKVQYRKSIDGTTDEIIAGCVNLTRKIIWNAPTLDYKDLIPQGEWIVTEEIPGLMKSVECSACHWKTTYCKPRFNDIRLTSFCPDCGARMTK